MKARDIYEALVFLEYHGMPETWLVEIHHKSSPERYAKGKRYWLAQAEKGSELKTVSEYYGHRLCFVAEGVRSGRRDFGALASEAKQRWPY